MYSFMLVYDLGWRYALHDGYCSSWDELVKVCAAHPPNTIPDFCGYVVFRANQGEEYRLANAWTMLEESGDIELVRLNPKLGLPSIMYNYVPALNDGFGNGTGRYPDLKKQLEANEANTERGGKPAKLSGILAKLAGDIEERRVENEPPQGYTPSEEERNRWEWLKWRAEQGDLTEFPAQATDEQEVED